MLVIATMSIKFLPAMGAKSTALHASSGAVSLRRLFRQAEKRKDRNVGAAGQVDNLNYAVFTSTRGTQVISERADTMFRTHHFVDVASRAVVVGRNGARFISFLKIKETVQRTLGMSSDDKLQLPYGHVCQVGDPVLRGRAMKIQPEVVRMTDFQKVFARSLQQESHP